MVSINTTVNTKSPPLIQQFREDFFNFHDVTIKV
nr:MAG TPA: hypothetical protein [Caudoviricetes sp.]DAZ24888.1 MAG TPA: hypothetical protein [Caudoviricetes sp.]